TIFCWSCGRSSRLIRRGSARPGAAHAPTRAKARNAASFRRCPDMGRSDLLISRCAFTLSLRIARRPPPRSMVEATGRPAETDRQGRGGGQGQRGEADREIERGGRAFMLDHESIRDRRGGREEKARREQPADKGAIGSMIEQDERQGAARDRQDAVRRAVEEGERERGEVGVGAEQAGDKGERQDEGRREIERQ